MEKVDEDIESKIRKVVDNDLPIFIDYSPPANPLSRTGDSDPAFSGLGVKSGSMNATLSFQLI